MGFFTRQSARASSPSLSTFADVFSSRGLFHQIRGEPGLIKPVEGGDVICHLDSPVQERCRGWPDAGEQHGQQGTKDNTLRHSAVCISPRRAHHHRQRNADEQRLVRSFFSNASQPQRNIATAHHSTMTGREISSSFNATSPSAELRIVPPIRCREGARHHVAPERNRPHHHHR